MVSEQHHSRLAVRQQLTRKSVRELLQARRPIGLGGRVAVP